MAATVSGKAGQEPMPSPNFVASCSECGMLSCVARLEYIEARTLRYARVGVSFWMASSSLVYSLRIKDRFCASVLFDGW